MRPWIVSALVVGIVVAAILAWPDGNESKAGETPDTPQAPRPLAEAEVRTYLEVMPAVQNVLGRASTQIFDDWDKTGRFSSDAQLNMRVQAGVDAILLKHKLNRAQFQTLRSRVSYAVDVVRYEEETEERAAERAAALRRQEELRRAVKDGTDAQKAIDQKIAKLKAEADMPGPPLSDSDRALLKRYWKQLTVAVPRRGRPQ